MSTSTRSADADLAPARSGGHSRLTPRWRKVVLTVHVATAVGLIGVDLVVLSLGISGLRGSDPATVYPAMHTVASTVLAPMAILALAVGVVQGLLGRYGLFRHWWVTAKLVVTTALTALVLAVVVPGLGRAADSATGLSAEALTDGQRAAFVVTPSVTFVLLVLMVVLGMYKPTRRRRT